MSKLIERYSFGKIVDRGTMPHFLEFQIILMKIFCKLKWHLKKEKIKDLKRFSMKFFRLNPVTGY